MSSTDGTVTIERRGAVVLVTLSRPERANALNQTMWEALEQIALSLMRDPARAVIFTGEGKAFCAGYDIRPDNPMTATMYTAIQGKEEGPLRETLGRLNGIMDLVERLPMPTLAAINGSAHGGGLELALRCDLRVMDAEAVLCMAETRIGLIPDLGGTVRLVALLGRSRALDLILTARDVRADEALALGLVNKVAPPGQALQAALDLAGLMAQNGPVALRCVKRAVREMEDLARAGLAERHAAISCMLSQEAVEGVMAWMAKRPPQFKDPT